MYAAFVGAGSPCPFIPDVVFWDSIYITARGYNKHKNAFDESNACEKTLDPPPMA